MNNLAEKKKRSLAILGFIFVLLALGITSAGYLSYRNFEQHLRAQVEDQLTAIANLKADELRDWRNERLMVEAEILRQNPDFALHVQQFFENPHDLVAQTQLQSWLQSYRAHGEYDRARLLDPAGRTRLADSGELTPISAAVAAHIPAVLQSQQVTLVDFYLSDNDQNIYLALLVPIMDTGADRQVIGLVHLRIDPHIYLYPYLEQWPMPSASAETLLARREGTEVVALNNLRFKPEAALTFRLPLTATDHPAVKAALGQAGIVAGLDYRGQPVVADIRAVPDSPWLLVAKMDTAEAYAPLRERLWQSVIFFGALILAVGVGLVLVWRQQALHYYRQQVEAVETLRQSEELYRTLVETLDVTLCRWLPDTTLVFTNEKYRRIFGLRDEGVGQQWLNLLPEAARAETAAFYRELAINPQTVSYEHPVTVDDGQTRYYQWIDTPILNAAGKLVEFQSVGIDLTERKQAEELVHAQRDLARIMSTATSSQAAWPLCLEVTLRVSGMDCGGIYLFNGADGALELVYQQGLGAEFVQAVSRYAADTPNARMMLAGSPLYLTAAELSGHRHHQVEGLQTLAVIPVHYQGRALGCLNVGSHSLAHVPDFSRQALETLASEIGNIITYLHTTTALRESEEKYRSLIDSQDAVIATIDAEGVYHYMNSIGAAPLAGSPEAVVGRNLADFFPAPSAEWQLSGIRQVIATGQGQVIEYQAGVAGRLSWRRVSIQPVRNAAGQVVLATINSVDITERKQAEEMLRESQLRVELALQGANMGMWDWNVPSGQTVFNDRWAEMIGYSLPELEPVNIQTWSEACHPDDLKISNERLERHFVGETDFYECEARLKHKNGSWIWVIDRGQVVEWDANGNPVRMTGTHLDITERKLSEQALLELNRTLEERVQQRTAEVQDLYDNAPTGYHSLDANGNVVMINQTELKWLGYNTPAEVIGRSISDFVTPASLATFRAYFPDFKQRGWVRDQELEMVRRDGSTFPVLLSATAMYDEQGRFMMSRSTVFDNSERKKAEIALRESEEQNRLLFEEAPDAVVLFDEAGRVVQMNRAFEMLTGYTAAQLTGYGLDRMGLVPSEQIGRLAAAVTQHLQSDRNFAAVEFKLKHANGESRDVGARIFGLEIRGHQHYLTTLRDITADKQAAETLRRANAELARAARTKDEFLANMSHELRTPLNAILGLSEALLEQVRGPLNERQQTAIHHIETSGRHLLALINDILDLSKVEAGRLELQLQPVSVADVCQASMLFVKEIALKKQLQLAIQQNDHLAKVEADPKRLKQMLVNLLSNAVKFTPAGGQVSLDVTADAEAGVIRFAVQDSGIGIAPADVARLFQPFMQVDSSLSRQYEGTGLGLALVRRLAELHGGSITVESDGVPGRGSRFTLALPYRRPEAVESKPAAASFKARSAPLHSALVVEDIESVAEQLSYYLREMNIHAVVHSQGEGALEQATTLQPDVIFLDLLMPDQSGWAVLAHLKAEPRTRAIPVIIVSVVDERSRGLAAGAVDYLVKPISREILRQAVDKVTARPESGYEALVIAPQPAPAEAAEVGALILLAEDNEANLLTTGDYLQDKGYQVVIARNGQEALDRAGEARPDLILMDIQMPELDGLEAIRRLRAIPEFAAIPIIALTALAMPGDRERCLAAGASEYFTKPVSLKELAETMTTLLKT